MPCVKILIQRFAMVTLFFFPLIPSSKVVPPMACWLQMFIFGTTALEQFMERVIEWPQYCNHILQISHLRGTRSRLVLEIEQELNKISVSQNDTNLNAMIPEDQRVSVVTQFTENAEVFTSICCKNYRLFLLVVCHFNLSKLTIIF
jgi:hypothetical protein